MKDFAKKRTRPSVGITDMPKQKGSCK